MYLKLMLLFSIFEITYSYNVKDNKKKIIKNSVSRVTWQNEDNFDKLEYSLLGHLWKHNKLHSAQRKYNDGFEKPRTMKPTPTTTIHAVTRSNNFDKNSKDRHAKMKVKDKTLSIGSSNIKRTFKKVPSVMEGKHYFVRNKIQPEALQEGMAKESKSLSMKKHEPKKQKHERKHTGRSHQEQVNFKKQQVTFKKQPPIMPEKDLTYPMAAVYRGPQKVYDGLKEENQLIRDKPFGPVQIAVVDYGNSWQKSHSHKKPMQGSSSPSKDSDVRKGLVHEKDNYTVADQLAQEVRVLCWVLTHPKNHNKTCKPIKDTWGSRCDKLLFMSTELDESIPTVKLHVPEGRAFLWPKVKAAFRYVHTNYRHQYDWFVRADDDTFMVIENLRYMLADYDPDEALYFGCRFKRFTRQKRQRESFMYGGAGIVLSRSALEYFITGITGTQCQNTLDNEMDDLELGICLSRMGVKAVDTRDVAHKGRFMVFMPQHHVSPVAAKTDWFFKYIYHRSELGENCCSDFAISFHYVSPDDMYALYYLIYKVRVYGLQYGSAPIPVTLNKTTHTTEVAIDLTTVDRPSNNYDSKMSANWDSKFDDSLGVRRVLNYDDQYIGTGITSERNTEDKPNYLKVEHEPLDKLDREEPNNYIDEQTTTTKQIEVTKKNFVERKKHRFTNKERLIEVEPNDSFDRLLRVEQNNDYNKFTSTEPDNISTKKHDIAKQTTSERNDAIDKFTPAERKVYKGKTTKAEVFYDLEQNEESEDPTNPKRNDTIHKFSLKEQNDPVVGVVENYAVNKYDNVVQNNAPVNNGDLNEQLNEDSESIEGVIPGNNEKRETVIKTTPNDSPWKRAKQYTYQIKHYDSTNKTV